MKNYFKIFGLKEIFEIDLDDLEKKYFVFQQQFHPDKSSFDEIEKSIEINEGHKILADDFLRACHLLQLKGIDILHDEKAIKVDQQTLQRVLDLQEKIAEISDKNEIKNLGENILAEMKLNIASSVKCLELNDIALAVQFLVKAKYLKKSLQDLKNKKK